VWLRVCGQLSGFTSSQEVYPEGRNEQIRYEEPMLYQLQGDGTVDWTGVADPSEPYMAPLSTKSLAYP